MNLLALKGLASFFLNTQMGRILGIILMILTAFWLYTASVRKSATRAATTAVTAQVVKAGEKEEKRQTKAVVKVQKRSLKDIAEINRLKEENTELLRKIDEKATPADDVVVFDADGLRELQALR